MCVGHRVQNSELAKFSNRPAACHYAALKRVFKYLRQNRHYVMAYWWPLPLTILPYVPFTPLLPMEPTDVG
jgi:hypothetical protein